jgi:hypothetical protein
MRLDNGIETVRSMTKRRVAVLSMMETSTSKGDNGTETWKYSVNRARAAAVNLIF